MSPRFFLTAAAINGALTVALGAFGAHGLKQLLSQDLLKTFHTGADYHGLHALALLATGLLLLHRDSKAGRVAGWAFLIGILVFSGSLYLLAITGQKWLGMITPFGGTAFIVGWIALAIAAWRIERT